MRPDPRTLRLFLGAKVDTLPGEIQQQILRFAEPVPLAPRDARLVGDYLVCGFVSLFQIITLFGMMNCLVSMWYFTGHVVFLVMGLVYFLLWCGTFVIQTNMYGVYMQVIYPPES